MTLRTEGKQGKLTKTITVVSNDPVKPRATIQVVADVKVLVGLDPQVMAFGEVKVGKKATRSVRLVGQEAAGVTLELLEGGDKGLSAAVRKEGEETLVDVTVDPKEPGRLKGRLSFGTSHATVTRLDLRVSGEVIGNVRVAPSAVTIQGVDGQPAPGVVVLSSEAAGFKVLSAIDPNGQVDATWAERDGRWRIEVKPKTSGPGTASFRSHLVVVTNDALQPQIDVPVLARATMTAGGRALPRVAGSRVKVHRGAAGAAVQDAGSEDGGSPDEGKDE